MILSKNQPIFHQKSITTYLIGIFFLISSSSFGQYQIGLVPRVSPDCRVYQKIGFTEIEVTYGSPALNDRFLAGNLIPYDKPWRAGANNATTITFSDDVLINGMDLPKGTYAFFIIARENQPWTAIFSNNEKQWGAFRYNSDEDALRVPIIPQPSTHQNRLRYTIEHYGFSDGRIKLNWGRLLLSLDIKTKYLDQFEREVESRVQNSDSNIRSVIYIQGAEHLVQTKANLSLAEQWISRAEERFPLNDDWNKQYYPKAYIRGHLLWVKAQLFALKKDYNSAISMVDQMKSIDNKQIYYSRNQARENIDSKYNEWSNNK